MTTIVGNKSGPEFKIFRRNTKLNELCAAILLQTSRFDYVENHRMTYLI
jgi:hypothetical protein